ncbi:hypothetical protein U3516DRAFT_771977 [Neocallimastix sp. 'constans']
MYNSTAKLPPINSTEQQNPMPQNNQLPSFKDFNRSTSTHVYPYSQPDSMDKSNQGNDLSSHSVNQMSGHNMPGKQISPNSPLQAPMNMHSSKMPIHVSKNQNKPIANVPPQMSNIQSPIQQQMNIIQNQSSSNINSIVPTTNSSSSSIQPPPSSQPPSSQASIQSNQYNYNQQQPQQILPNQLPPNNTSNPKSIKPRQKTKQKTKQKIKPNGSSNLQQIQPAPPMNPNILPNPNIPHGQNLQNMPLLPQNNSMNGVNGRNPLAPINNSNNSMGNTPNQSIPSRNNNNNNNGPMNQIYPNSVPMNNPPPSHNRPPMQNNDISSNSSSQSNYRTLNVKDALSYLEQVKEQFNESPQVYNDFLEIMKDFKSQRLSTPGVIDRVSTLFKDHPSLITGFNTFLPPGFSIPPLNNQEPIKGNQMNQQPNSMMMNMNQQQPMPNNNQQHQMQYYNNNNNNNNNNQNYNLNIPNNQQIRPNSLSTQNDMKIMPSSTNSYNNNSNNINMPNQNKQKSPLNTQRRSLPNIMPMNNNMQQQMQYNMMNSNQINNNNNNNNNNNRDMQYGGRQRAPVEFNHAINFVNKIKVRFKSEQGKYKQFLEILQIYQKEQKPIHEVYSQVQVLFQDQPDLLEEFKNFLPDSTQNSIINNKPMRPIQAKMPSGNMMSNNENINNNLPMNNNYQQQHTQRSNSISIHGSSQKQIYPMDNMQNNLQQNMKMTPQNQMQQNIQQNDMKNHFNKRQGGHSMNQLKSHKRNFQVANNNIPLNAKNQNILYDSHSPNKKCKTSDDDTQSSSDELELFNRAKQVIGNKVAYDEFLAILNQFAQVNMDSKTLVEKVEPYIGHSPEFFEYFKNFVKYKGDETISNIPAIKSINDPENTYKFIGKSYFKAPENLSNLICTGKDDLCKSVLNDKYISRSISIDGKTPNYIPINIYDEVLYNCEDERYKYDYNLTLCRSTIELFELMAIKFSNMSNEEKSNFKFFDLIDDDIIDAINNKPAEALPLLLKRLKQKEEEWSHSQYEWNKIWCQIDKNNREKALDHLASSYKEDEKLNLNNQVFIKQIERLYKEGLVHHHTEDFTMDEDSYDDNKKYHYSLKFLDSNVLQDLHILIRQYLKAENITGEEYDKVENFFKKFLSEFFSETFDISAEEDIEINKMLKKELHPSEISAMGINESNGKSVIKAFHKIEESGNDNNSTNAEPINSTSASVSITTKENENGSVTTTYYRSNKNIPLNLEAESSQSDMDIDNSSMHESKNEDTINNNKKKRNQRNMDVEDWRRRARIGHLQHRNECYIFYADSHFYCFFRLLHVLYKRLMHVKEISLLKIKNSSSIKKYPDIYKDKLQLIIKLIDKKCTQEEFEDESKKLVGNEAYKLFTINKIIAKTVEEINFILNSGKTEELLNISRKYHQLTIDKDSKIIKEEGFKYLLEINNLLQASQIYKMEYLIKSNDIANMKNISIQLQKWKDFIKSFCLLQVENDEIMKSKKIRFPYMKRNLISNPEYINNLQFPEYSINKSGLRFLICPKNYQIKYVTDTEDYFIKYGSKIKSLQKKSEIVKKEKQRKFMEWLNKTNQKR